jgi:hypothetical protein
VRRAHADIGIEERVDAANRSPYLDTIAQFFGSPIGSAWCALTLGWWCYETGVAFPDREVGAVRAWQSWAIKHGCWREKSYTPLPGDKVIYDMKPDGLGDHIGVVARVHARGVRTIEGNTSYAGFSREGVAVVYKPVATKFILGYIVPRASGHHVKAAA